MAASNYALMVAKKWIENQLKNQPEPPVGSVDVNEILTLEVKGTVKKAEDYERTPTVSIPLKATLALVLEKSGITRDRSMAILVEAMNEALQAQEQGEEYVKDMIRNVVEAENRVQNMLGQLDKVTVSGSKTIKENVTEIVNKNEVAIQLLN
jgi:hypothetical protein